MQVVKLSEIFEQNEAVVYFDEESGLLISTNVDHYFAYFKIQDTHEYEFVGPFPTDEYLIEEVNNNGKDLNIIQLLILGAKNLASLIDRNKIAI